MASGIVYATAGTAVLAIDIELEHTGKKKMKDPNFEERMKFLYGFACLYYIKFSVENSINDMIKAGKI